MSGSIFVLMFWPLIGQLEVVFLPQKRPPFLLDFRTESVFHPLSFQNIDTPTFPQLFLLPVWLLNLCPHKETKYNTSHIWQKPRFIPSICCLQEQLTLLRVSNLKCRIRKGIPWMETTGTCAGLFPAGQTGEKVCLMKIGIVWWETSPTS